MKKAEKFVKGETMRDPHLRRILQCLSGWISVMEDQYSVLESKVGKNECREVLAQIKSEIEDEKMIYRWFTDWLDTPIEKRSIIND